LNFDFVLQKRLFQIKTAIYEKVSTQKITSNFNDHRPSAKMTDFQNCKGKYENRKILDFARKNEKE
jgi:hypothetical protein